MAKADAYDPELIDWAQARLREKTGRHCGGCTACCRPFAIAAIEKPPNTWCRHCTVGTGCKIYATRPNACRGFACAWLYGAGTETDRPDLAEVLWDTHELVPGCYIIRCIEVIPGGYQRLTSKDPGVLERIPGALGNFLVDKGHTVILETLLVGAKQSVIVAPRLTERQREALITYTTEGVDE